VLENGRKDPITGEELGVPIGFVRGLVVGSFSFFFSARLLNRFTEKREKFLLQSIFASIGPLEKNKIAAPFRTFTGRIISGPT
jgi:hypothetical protein